MSLLNWNKDFALEQAADDEELLQELIDIFKTSFTSDLQIMKNGVEADDCSAVANAAHSIKGASSSLGMEGIIQVAMEIEDDAKNGSTEVATQRFTQLEQLLEEVKNL